MRVWVHRNFALNISIHQWCDMSTESIFMQSYTFVPVNTIMIYFMFTDKKLETAKLSPRQSCATFQMLTHIYWDAIRLEYTTACVLLHV